MEKTSKVLAEDFVGCLAKKEEYNDVICGRKICNCRYCDIKMSDCPYYQTRANDKEVKKDDWKKYLLDFMAFMLIMIAVALPVQAMTPLEFDQLTEGLIVEREVVNVNCQWITTTSFYGYFSTVRKFPQSIQITITRDEKPRYQMISVSTENGEMVLIVKEWKDKIPIILYKNPNKKLLGVIGEVEL